jgi:cation diffusion facilitator CzcD-associated flavoprotein CzcO
MLSTSPIPVAIIGAGPYGLSLSSYLRGAEVPHRIFGSPMSSWRTQMPAGMFLKSEGFASNLAQPDGEMTLRAFCEEAGYAYRDYGLPIPLRVFVNYGLAFQQHFVPGLEDTTVREIKRHDRGFALQLATGERVLAQHVVVATGIDAYRHVPQAIADLPSEFHSHTGDHHDYSRFSGRAVCVVGGGASATDVAAALYAAGADVHLVTRKKLLWLSRRTERPLFERWFMRDYLGAGRLGQGHFYSDAPHVFRYFPRAARRQIARTYLGPRGGWPVRECIEQIPTTVGFGLDSVEIDGTKAVLHLLAKDGRTEEIRADHIIAGTGYRIDLRRLPFLHRDLQTTIQTFAGGPTLSAHFESSVPGLYFIGVSALYNFGPLMRFVAGTRFVSRRVAAHLVEATRERNPFLHRPAGLDRLIPRMSSRTRDDDVCPYGRALAARRGDDRPGGRGRMPRGRAVLHRRAFRRVGGP